MKRRDTEGNEVLRDLQRRHREATALTMPRCRNCGHPEGFHGNTHRRFPIFEATCKCPGWEVT